MRHTKPSEETKVFFAGSLLGLIFGLSFIYLFPALVLPIVIYGSGFVLGISASMLLVMEGEIRDEESE